MTWLIVPEDKLDELNDLNSGYIDRKCVPVQTIDGVYITSSDKLADDYWQAYHEWLESLEPFVGVPVFDSGE